MLNPQEISEDLIGTLFHWRENYRSFPHREVRDTSLTPGSPQVMDEALLVYLYSTYSRELPDLPGAQKVPYIPPHETNAVQPLPTQVSTIFYVKLQIISANDGNVRSNCEDHVLYILQFFSRDSYIH